MSNAPAAPHMDASQCAVTHIFEQSSKPLTKTSLLLDTIKTLENRMVARGLLSPDAANMSTPLWFLAESERNVFLWRRGISLAEQDKIEFWVDLPRLIEKRINALSHCTHGQPFPKSMLDEPSSNDGNAKECAYLREFESRFAGIAVHAHALSCIASQARIDLFGSSAKRPRVILPYNT